MTCTKKNSYIDSLDAMAIKKVENKAKKLNRFRSLKSTIVVRVIGAVLMSLNVSYQFHLFARF